MGQDICEEPTPYQLGKRWGLGEGVTGRYFKQTKLRALTCLSQLNNQQFIPQLDANVTMCVLLIQINN